MPLVAEPPQPTLSENLVNVWPRELQLTSAAQACPPIPALRISVSERVTSSGWFRPVLERLRSSAGLVPGWDSYAATPMNPSAVEKALRFLAGALEPISMPPSVVALSDGGLKLLWHRNGIDVELTFARDESELYFRDRANGDELEVDLTDQRATAEAMAAIVPMLRA